MSGYKTEEWVEEIVIDTKELREGTSHVRKLGDGKVSISKEGGKIKIFEVVKEE